MLDVIVMNDPRNTVKIPLVRLTEAVRITVKTLGNVEKKYGKLK